MQKKILASLLLTGSMATPALAAYPLIDDLEANKWNNNTIPGGAMGNGLTITGNTVEVEAGLTNIPLSQTTIPLPAGTYMVQFANAKNVSVEVTGPGVTMEGADRFTIDSATDVAVTVSIKSADGMGGYSFDKAEIVLDFDKDTAVDEMQAALDDLTLETVDTDRKNIAEKLAEQEAILEAEKT